MNRNYLWRAVAYSTDHDHDHDEVYVFVDAPDRETAKERIYERLAKEWNITKQEVEFYNLWNETELRENGENVLGSQPLLETGIRDSQVHYDPEPLVLVASSNLRKKLYALREVRHD